MQFAFLDAGSVYFSVLDLPCGIAFVCSAGDHGFGGHEDLCICRCIGGHLVEDDSPRLDSGSVHRIRIQLCDNRVRLWIIL